VEKDVQKKTGKSQRTGVTLFNPGLIFIPEKHGFEVTFVAVDRVDDRF
jgi:hypothetical protein